jgi:hypothetical protein
LQLALLGGQVDANLLAALASSGSTAAVSKAAAADDKLDATVGFRKTATGSSFQGGRR